MPSTYSDKVAGTYGPTGFVAAFLNIFVLEVFTWFFMVLAWYLLPVVVLPAVIINALVAYGLTKVRGTTAQIGRGMLIGCACSPLTVAIFATGYIVAQAIGPI
jgi:hypothetical protein